MADEILESVALDIKTINTELARAKDFLKILKEAGEDTAKMEADIRSLEVRKKKWERVLEARGYSTK